MSRDCLACATDVRVMSTRGDRAGVMQPAFADGMWGRKHDLARRLSSRRLRPPSKAASWYVLIASRMVYHTLPRFDASIRPDRASRFKYFGLYADPHR